MERLVGKGGSNRRARGEREGCMSQIQDTQVWNYPSEKREEHHMRGELGGSGRSWWREKNIMKIYCMKI